MMVDLDARKVDLWGFGEGENFWVSGIGSVRDFCCEFGCDAGWAVDIIGAGICGCCVIDWC